MDAEDDFILIHDQSGRRTEPLIRFASHREKTTEEAHRPHPFHVWGGAVAPGLLRPQQPSINRQSRIPSKARQLVWCGLMPVTSSDGIRLATSSHRIPPETCQREQA